MPSFLALTHGDLVAWVLLPLFIFVARTADVGLNTLRILFLSQGRSLLAPMVGFFEALLWLVVIGQILQHLSNPLCVVAYAGGFAAGNAFGMFLERRLAIGMQMVRIVTHRDAEVLIEALKARDYGITVVDATGAMGKVKILFTVVRRRDVGLVLELIRQHNPKAFISVEDVRRAEEGVFPRPSALLPGAHTTGLARQLRKAK